MYGFWVGDFENYCINHKSHINPTSSMTWIRRSLSVVSFPKDCGVHRRSMVWSVLSDSEAVELNDLILEYFSHVSVPFLTHKYDGFNT